MVWTDAGKGFELLTVVFTGFAGGRGNRNALGAKGVFGTKGKSGVPVSVSGSLFVAFTAVSGARGAL